MARHTGTQSYADHVEDFCSDEGTCPACPAPAHVRTYTDALNRTQTAVDGPRGTYLITQAKPGAAYEVWRSDSLRTLGRHRDRKDAIAHASRAAGITT